MVTPATTNFTSREKSSYLPPSPARKPGSRQPPPSFPGHPAAVLMIPDCSKNELNMKEPVNNTAFLTWVGARELKQLEEKNISAKNMLAAALKDNTHSTELNYFEYYQNRFLELDEKLRQLRTDLQYFEAPDVYAQHQYQHINAAPQGLAASIKNRYDELCMDIDILTNAFRTYLDSKHNV